MGLSFKRQRARLVRRFAQATAQLVAFLFQFDHAQFPADHGALGEHGRRASLIVSMICR